MSYQTEIIVDSQPGPLGPGAVFSVGALPGGAWSSELCDCCSDVGTCLCGALVPCILASRVSERFGQTCLLPCLPGALVALRTGIRERYRIERFHGNYACVAAALALYCLITSPLLVVALAVFLGACYVLHVRAQQGPLVVLGRELSAGQQYAVAGGVSFPLFWVAGAGSAVFWVLGATLVVIGSHAAFYETEPAEGEELQMEPV
ncbi:prenylated Rab acceptor protein 1 isoform B [Alligator mississippiensis]|uniref:PRA1 family protein n=1 Tax=Alligator mississippiensis TaxID=8496 RepID=A0A151M3T3_ALLMI|nr:prenylated Rab acceptor protein 1 isoform B [Alligator mississippiensis]